MDENKNLGKIDELLESTSSDKRFNFEEIVPDLAYETDDTPTQEPVPAAVAAESVEDVEETVEETQDIPVQPQETSQGIRIIDETSTTVVFEESSDVSIDDLLPDSKKIKKANKAKQPKGKIKFNVLQIIIMVVAAVAAVWCIMFTVDHTLAAQGISPVFCKRTAVYEDNSASYKGLGYKVQFKFDSKGNLTQKVLPAWKDGPNDISYIQE